MSLKKWLRAGAKKHHDQKKTRDEFDEDVENERRDDEDAKATGREVEDESSNDNTKIVYYACESPVQSLLNVLNNINKNFVVSLI